MIPNLPKQQSIKYKRDEELTELERLNKQLLLQEKELDKYNKIGSSKGYQYTDQLENMKYLKIENGSNHQKILNIDSQNDEKNKQNVNNTDKLYQKNIESTENDFILAQLLEYEINLPQQKQETQNYFQNNSEELKSLNKTDKQYNIFPEKNKFYNNQSENSDDFYKKRGIQLYNKNKKPQNELVEVNDQFIMDVLNRQYPQKQKIQQINSKNEANKPIFSQQQNKNTISIKDKNINSEQIKQNNDNYQTQKEQSSLNFRLIDDIKYCELCGDYQRQNQFENHKSQCKMANVECDFCEKPFPRYIIHEHINDCLRKQENKLLQLYQRTFEQEGLEINRTSEIFFGSRETMRRQFNLQQFQQDKEIERIIVQNQRKIQKSFQKNIQKSEYYAEVQYVQDKSSSQAEDCCICFCSFSEKEKLGMLPCAHKFHTHCIDSWIKVKKICPLCKRPF